MKGEAVRPLNSDLDLMSDSLSFVGEGHDLETYEECLIVLEELAGQTDRLVYSVSKMLTQTHDAQEFLDKTVPELIPFLEELEEMERVHKRYKSQIRRGKRKLEKILKKLVEINIITKMI
jgi:DNA repair ATPase RecN